MSTEDTFSLLWGLSFRAGKTKKSGKKITEEGTGVQATGWKDRKREKVRRGMVTGGPRGGDRS